MQAVRVCIVALPDAVISTMAGLFDVMQAAGLLGLPDARPFEVAIVGDEAGPLLLASGLPMTVQRTVRDVAAADIVIVPSLLVPGAWTPGRYPQLVAWLARMHRQGAVLCSACSGLFLLAETGLFDGADATVHFAYADSFEAAHPATRIHPDRVLVVAGARDELVSCGASTTWHDMAMYLIARFAGSIVAQEVARRFALVWHQDSLAPYIVFEGRRGHGDAAVERAQAWLAQHFSVADPIAQAGEQAGLAERTFKRRFAQATGMAPLAYVQRLRIEAAKQQLERGDTPVDDIGWRVGYEDPAFFRRLFKRLTGLTPGDYRRRFSIPAFARP